MKELNPDVEGEYYVADIKEFIKNGDAKLKEFHQIIATDIDDVSSYNQLPV